MDRKQNERTPELHCPLPTAEYDTVVLAHGGGGSLSRQLIEQLFVQHFSNQYLDPLHDGAVLPESHGRIAMTTDSYVVSPIVFPGGNIGTLAVNGTVNDLAMCGAVPRFLTASFILEEGLPVKELEAIVESMAAAARTAGVNIVSGDTKVVPRGKADRMFITTTGIGDIPEGRTIALGEIHTGDVVIVSGTVGDHGMAVMSVREGLEFESAIVSDTVPLNGLVESIFSVSPDIHFLRDPTRGGVAGILNEIARSAGVGIRLTEGSIPVNAVVRAACDLLGFDPLYVANEGKLIAIVAASAGDRVLAAMQRHPYGTGASMIGEIVSDHPGRVVMRTSIGGDRVVDMISGEQLPRIC